MRLTVGGGKAVAVEHDSQHQAGEAQAEVGQKGPAVDAVVAWLAVTAIMLGHKNLGSGASFAGCSVPTRRYTRPCEGDLKLTYLMVIKSLWLRSAWTRLARARPA